MERDHVDVQTVGQEARMVRRERRESTMAR